MEALRLPSATSVQSIAGRLTTHAEEESIRSTTGLEITALGDEGARDQAEVAATEALEYLGIGGACVAVVLARLMGGAIRDLPKLVGFAAVPAIARRDPPARLRAG